MYVADRIMRQTVIRRIMLVDELKLLSYSQMG